MSVGEFNAQSGGFGGPLGGGAGLGQAGIGQLGQLGQIQQGFLSRQDLSRPEFWREQDALRRMKKAQELDKAVATLAAIDTPRLPGKRHAINHKEPLLNELRKWRKNWLHNRRK